MILGIDEITLLYYLIAGIIMLVGIVGTAINRKAKGMAFFYCLVVAVVMLSFRHYLEPALFGFFIHGYTLLGYIGLMFLMVWGGLLVLTLFNCIRFGSPVEKWNATKTDEQTKRVMTWLMVVLLLVTMFIPIYAGYYTQTVKTNVVLTVDAGDYYQTDEIAGDELLNMTDMANLLGTVVYEEINNDTVIAQAGGSPKLAYENTVTIVGSTNIVSGVNYTPLTISPSTILANNLDLTTGTLLDYDFLKLNSTDEHGNKYIGFFDGFNSLQLLLFEQTGNGTYTLTLDINDYTALALVHEDTPIYLCYLNVDDTDTAWQFEITTYNLATSVWGWDDFQLYGLSQVFSIVILGVALVFTTDTVDLVFDTRKKR